MCAFYYDELTRENCFKKKRFKMLTSYDNEEFTYPFLEEADLTKKPDEQSIMLKLSKVFQKTYYNEEIKGEQIKVPVWRMKEKVGNYFY